MSKLIGQTNFIKEVEALQSLPPFVILEGVKGQGKRTMAQFISKHFGYFMYTIDNKIADIRDMIANSQSLSTPTIYFIPDCDSMSIGAQNSLLKITEEPPNNLYIIMSLTHRDNTLKTITSRGRVLKLDEYTFDQLVDYYNTVHKGILEPDEMLQVATNPGEIDTLMNIKFEDFMNYVYKVYDNILNVSTGNSLKIGNNIAFKPEEEDKYPVELFLRTFNVICVKEIDPRVNKEPITKETIELITLFMRVTTQALSQLRIRGANKKSIFDIWVLNIRRYR